MRDAPPFFRDLNLDQVAAAVTAEWTAYDLAPFFFTPLTDRDAVVYRQEVMHELENAAVMAGVASFAEQLRVMRRNLGLSAEIESPQEGARWFLEAVRAYDSAVAGLAAALQPLALQSRGLRGLRDYLDDYVNQPPVRDRRARAAALAADLSAIRYALLIRDNSIEVLHDNAEPDYAAAVAATFEKFRRGAVRDYRSKFTDAGRLNHVEAQVLDRVALLHPDVFAGLAAFRVTQADFLDPRIARFDREVHFYLAYLKYIAPLRSAGLPFCYPALANPSREIAGRGVFDVALAAVQVARHERTVTNDFFLRELERVLVVTGPNHGGKTTFARMVGQIHYLASLGCAVPGSDARLWVCDRLFTHFERGETITSLRGKLEDDLVRIRDMLEQATPNSIIIMNEIFASTTLGDALYLSREIMAAVSKLDAIAVCVTFLDELASFDEKTVSMVAGVDPGDPSIRTFKLERRPADGLAYALAVAERYRVTRRWLDERIRA
jgi:hypothetical protein